MNGTKAYRSQVIQRLLMRPPKVAQRLVVPQTVGPSRPRIAGRIYKRLRKANIFQTEWRPISMDMSLELAERVRDDVDLLARLLNRDLNHWLDVQNGPANTLRQRVLSA